MRRVFRSWTVATVGVLMAAVAASGANWQPPGLSPINSSAITSKSLKTWEVVPDGLEPPTPSL